MLRDLTVFDRSGARVMTIDGFTLQASALDKVADGGDLGAAYFAGLLHGRTWITGSSGSDHWIEAGIGPVTHVAAGAGDDRVYLWHAGDLVYDGGEGTDLLAFRQPSSFLSEPGGEHGAAVNLAAGTGTSPLGGTLALSNVEDIEGTSHNDVLTGDAAANDLYAGYGNDRLRGGGGDDTLVGGGPADRLSGGAGDDALIPYGPVAGTVVDGGAGIDSATIQMSSGAGGIVIDLAVPDRDRGLVSTASSRSSSRPPSTRMSCTAQRWPTG